MYHRYSYPILRMAEGDGNLSSHTLTHPLILMQPLILTHIRLYITYPLTVVGGIRPTAMAMTENRRKKRTSFASQKD